MSQRIQKDWMDKYIFSKEYRDGVRYFIQFAIKYGYSKTVCACPCTSCRNKHNRVMEEVKVHLFTKGIDKRYRMWALHGEKSTNMMVELSMGEHVEEGNLPKENTEDERLRMVNFVDVACGVHEGVDGDVSRDEIDQTRDFEEPFAQEPDLGKRYTKYKKLAEEKLYPTYEGPETTLSTIVEIHNMKKMFGWSGNSVTYLLSTLKRWFPKGNTLPEKYPIMKV
ncbi:hypothetical protein BVC80_1785g8 [Macleaya cordata]|uniref:Transposase-associated domain-containing protein n=1 Tax=Macleaya cordata TaxID=56857 RepID=A0A200QFG6_MACCD|nr:hypothetical protein BVC80_1785g8 [Macleaya cordata]